MEKGNVSLKQMTKMERARIAGAKCIAKKDEVKGGDALKTT